MADPTWAEVKAKAEAEHGRAQTAINRHGADLTITEYHRGMLAAMETILALENKRKEIPGYALDV